MTVKKPFPLTTAAQNMCNLCRKLLLLGNHFFVCWKTANFSTVCGTVTLKSLLSLGPDAPHVHLRLRKRLSRCTLDYGFKTSESPALRGFVGRPRALATAVLEMSRNVQSGNTQNLKSMVIQRSFPKRSVAERRKTAAASDQAAVCACAHSRYFTGGSPSGLRV